MWQVGRPPHPTSGSDVGGRLYSWAMPPGDLALLLRLNKSWHDDISAEDLYKITRAWWVMSPANAQRVARVLAVAGGVVREVYQPTRWLPSPVDEELSRIHSSGRMSVAERNRRRHASAWKPPELAEHRVREREARVTRAPLSDSRLGPDVNAALQSCRPPENDRNRA